MSLVKKGKQAYRAMARALVSAWKVLLRLLTKQGQVPCQTQVLSSDLVL